MDKKEDTIGNSKNNPSEYSSFLQKTNTIWNTQF